MRIERQLQGTLNTLLTECIKERHLEHLISPYLPQEEGRADILLKTPAGKNIFPVELKDPTARDGDIYNAKLMMREAERAEMLGAKHFGICNFMQATLLVTNKMRNSTEMPFRGKGFTMQEIKLLQSNYNAYINQAEFLDKLKGFANYYIDLALEFLTTKTIKTLPIDEAFIYRMNKLIDTYVHGIALQIQEEYQKNRGFQRRVNEYTKLQQWDAPTSLPAFVNLTSIALLVLISKLIFYKTYYDNKAYSRLAPLQISEELENQTLLKREISAFFKEFKDITDNFETLIGNDDDVIFEMPFIAQEVVEVVRQTLNSIELYDFSKISYDIIGRIFENLIQPTERHKLGQYFTPPDIIDLMLAFAIETGNEKVFDPSCGSGTFLVRAYQRKKDLTQKMHTHLISEIYGNDISNYPAYLAMLNLAVRNVTTASYPRVLNKDFFRILLKNKELFHDMDRNPVRQVLPAFDAIVGNPPYTRQEDIGEMQGTATKDEIQGLIKQQFSFTPSARTSIYAYFFYHADTFLREGGVLAFLVSNSWLDTDFGTDLQRFLCKRYEIIAILDSQVERFFPTASVNTSVVIARKQKNEKKRDKNTVRFVYLQEPLADLLKKHKGADNLKKIIDVSQGTTQGIKVMTVPQTTLQTDTKWGKYLKAPEVYFDIMARGAGKFVALKDLAGVKRGFTTGSNDFFVVAENQYTKEPLPLMVAVNKPTPNIFETQAQLDKAGLTAIINGWGQMWFIEKQFVQPFFKSSREASVYELNADTATRVLIVPTDKANDLQKYPYLQKYVAHGESKDIHTLPTCASRKPWFAINEQKPANLFFNKLINDVGRTFKGDIFYNDSFYGIYPTKNAKSIFYYLNSTIMWLFQQANIRSNFGDGAGEFKVYELEDFPTIDIDLENVAIDLGETRNYREELGTLESLDTVNPERVKLDTEILKAIGYAVGKDLDATLLALYRETKRLIEQRTIKANSQKTAQTKQRDTIRKLESEELEALFYEHIATEAGLPENSFKFAKKIVEIAQSLTSQKKKQASLLQRFWQTNFQTDFDLDEIQRKDQGKLF